MLKKMTVLAMAVGVVAALALPASASANWKHHNTATQANVNVGLTGQARFQGGIGGVECQVTSAVTFVPGTTGTVNTFVPHPTDAQNQAATKNCKGLGGLAFCTVHNVSPQALPWTLHTNQANSTINVTSGNITSTFTGGFCPVKAITLTGATVGVTPNQPNTVSTVKLSGSMQADLQTNNETLDKEVVTISGDLSVEAPNATTYSV